MNPPAATPAAAPVESDWESRGHIHSLLLIAATAVGIYLCYRLVLPFLPSLTWALVLAVMFTPVHRRLAEKLRRPNLTAGITVLLVSLIVAVPAIFLGQRLLEEATKGTEIVKTKVESGEWRRAVEADPRFAPAADWIERTVDLSGTAKAMAGWLTATAGAIVKGSLTQVAEFCLTFYLFFYFLRDRQQVLRAVKFLSPLSGAEMGRLLDRVNDTVHATIYGTVAVAALQGLLGGLMFWWLGLPAALLWGVVMALFAVIPVLGAFVVWIPAALFLLIDGSWQKALILTVWGAVVVGGIDNVLRPVLSGSRLRVHAVPAFISIVGGVAFFGPSGLILGPVTLAITAALLEIWRHRGDDAAAKEP